MQRRADGAQGTKVKGETPVPPVFAEEWPPGPTERAELGQEDGQRAQEGSEVRKVQGQTVQEQSRMQRKDGRRYIGQEDKGVHRMTWHHTETNVVFSPGITPQF